MKIYLFPNLNTILWFYIVLFLFLKPDCNSQDVKLDINSDSTSEVFDAINTIKETAKDLPNPEDIPEVSDWVERCKNIVGGRTWKVIRNSPNRILDCVSKYIKPKKLKVEIEDSMERGELELVFKKYCGRRDNIMKCIDETLELVKPCMSEQQLIDLNITLNAVEAGIDFTCFENGDRIALFLAENGVQCLENTSSAMRDCVENKIPEAKSAIDDIRSTQLDQFLVNTENCRKISLAHQCVTTATKECDDPTPSNILDSLIMQAMKVTPCSQYALNASNGFYLQFWNLFPHILTLILAGLTAANILL